MIESEFIPEFVPLKSPYFIETEGQPVEAYELVLTSLGRAGCQRYDIALVMLFVPTILRMMSVALFGCEGEY